MQIQPILNPIVFLSSTSNKAHIQYITLPKSGTRMLEKIFSLMNVKAEVFKQQFLHINQLYKKYNKNLAIQKLFKNNRKVIFLYRDPRDNLISMIHYINKTHHASVVAGPIDNFKEWKQLPMSEQVSEAIKGKKYTFWANYTVPSIREIIKLKNAQLKNVMMLRFEDLVGEGAGGSPLTKQEATFNKIYKFIFPNAPAERKNSAVKKALEGYFGGTSTYRENEPQKVGQWVRYFSAEDIQIFKDRYNDLVLELGYETDPNWQSSP